MRSSPPPRPPRTFALRWRAPSERAPIRRTVSSLATTPRPARRFTSWTTSPRCKRSTLARKATPRISLLRSSTVCGAPTCPSPRRWACSRRAWPSLPSVSLSPCLTFSSRSWTQTASVCSAATTPLPARRLPSALALAPQPPGALPPLPWTCELSDTK
eukprot:Amastigsp_a677909_32.p3 type:complete len:158 gc:universal Amastigsp_a677909_32:494-21(-)